MLLTLGQRRSVDIQKKLELVETFNESRRWKEEKNLLVTEMKNYLRYFSQLLTDLTEDIASMYKCIEILYVPHNYVSQNFC